MSFNIELEDVVYSTRKYLENEFSECKVVYLSTDVNIDDLPKPVITLREYQDTSKRMSKDNNIRFTFFSQIYVYANNERELITLRSKFNRYLYSRIPLFKVEGDNATLTNQELLVDINNNLRTTTVDTEDGRDYYRAYLDVKSQVINKY